MSVFSSTICPSGDSDHGELHTDEGVEVMLVAAASDYLPALG